ncbi:BnaC04g44740D [Brassica napus]|uniref:BnaC04g44740D protein n=1 Tax=Brassica napus TaxID=3708 RepID=A0A078H3P2_BRANA|nr:BnaC04g44740D [Brassica napus]
MDMQRGLVLLCCVLSLLTQQTRRWP